jgi:triphosphoribosyl-dephospho-CoA synthase
MALAADRDRIGRLYRDGYAELFDIGVAALGSDFGGSAARARAGRPVDRGVAGAVLRGYLTLLGHAPDSHIVRKRGATVAHTVMAAAAHWVADPRLAEAGRGAEARVALARWDESLKADGLNPGTTADLTVTAMLLALITSPRPTR